MEIKVNKHYTYKGNEYVVMGFTKVKIPGMTPSWQEGVQYKSIVSSDPEVNYVSTLERFQNRFLPTLLEVGDEVVTFSMGKIYATYTVKSIDENGFVSYVNSTLITNNSIDKSGKIEYLSDAKDIVLDCYYLSKNLDYRLKNMTLIKEMSTMFSKFVTDINSLSVGTIDFSTLQSLKEEGEQYITKVMNVYGNK